MHQLTSTAYTASHSLVCSYAYRDALQDSLDPPLVTGRVRSAGTAALHSLIRVNRLFHAEALPFLYADVSIGLPASFEAFLGTVGVLQEDENEDDHGGGDGGGHTLDPLDRPGRPSRTSPPLFEERAGLLTPPASRETSRDRGENLPISLHSINQH